MSGYGGPLGPRPGAKKRANKLNVSGLGRSLVNDRQRQKKSGGHSDKYTTEREDPDWVKLQSVTQERPLDEFLSTAELAEKDFTTERTANIRIIQNGGEISNDNPFVLTEEQRAKLTKCHYENAGKITVPRRPAWTKEMTAHELDSMEKEAFLNWRRSLADLQENQDLLLTPFERNLEVWRQLWRVVERSDLVVQIVDGRNPILYRSVDLDNYVSEISANKRCLLLINKSDMLSLEQRQIWVEYFLKHEIQFAFFSAKAALVEQEARDLRNDQLDEKEEEEEDEDEDTSTAANPPVELNTVEVLSVEQLEALFEQAAPSKDLRGNAEQLQIGLVGYPNVGKSSTINALIGAKKVSVSSTPGKTKHFQTIKLSDQTMLCDCPGLVFPNFAQTNGDLVCNGVLPIDQLRDFITPCELVCLRIPHFFLEAVYGINIHIVPEDEGGRGSPTAHELLSAYALARGFTRQGGGEPDQSRAARYILKDYVNGKLLYCEPPPDYPRDSDFNRGKFNLRYLSDQRRNQVLEAFRAQQPDIKVDVNETDLADMMKRLKFASFDSTNANPSLKKRQPQTAGTSLDQEFFLESRSGSTSLLPFHLQKAAQAQAGSGKKHFKGKKSKK